MKIFFYINNIGYGGAERVMVNLASIFAENNHNVSLITSFRLDKEYEMSSKVNRYSLEKTESKTNFFKKNISRIKKLRKICKDERPDVLISFMGENNFRAILATKRLKTKTIISVRNDPNKEYPNKLFKFLAKTLYKKADGIVMQTEQAKAWFPKKIQKKACIIMNQVSEKFFNVNKDKGEYFIATGRLNSQKNYPLMIKAFAKYVEDNPQEKLFIYGDGELKQELQELIDTLGMNRNIILKGSSDCIHEKLKQAKCFLLSSDYEGIPNGLLEAMAVGVPSIATNCPCGGPSSIITNKENGILVPVGDEKAFYNALININDDSLREKLSNNAKKSAENFKPQVVYCKWEEYLKKIVGEK